MNTAAPVDNKEWLELHQKYVDECKSNKPEVVFIGDSLIQYMEVTEVWDNFFKPLNALNFGIGGDRTENVLWRVINGEMDNIQPKVIVILVGTNNICNTDQEVVDGILTIAEQIRYRQIQAQLIILGIPPKGRDPNSFRYQIELINKGLLEQAGNIPNCTFLPTDPNLFVNEDGQISNAIMFDYLHLTSLGYNIICEPLRKVIQLMLDQQSK